MLNSWRVGANTAVPDRDESFFRLDSRGRSWPWHERRAARWRCSAHVVPRRRWGEFEWIVSAAGRWCGRWDAAADIWQTVRLRRTASPSCSAASSSSSCCYCCSISSYLVVLCRQFVLATTHRLCCVRKLREDRLLGDRNWRVIRRRRTTIRLLSTTSMRKHEELALILSSIKSQ